MDRKDAIRLLAIFFLPALLLVGSGPMSSRNSPPTLNPVNADALLKELESNLKLLEAAKEEWAFANQRSLGDGMSIYDLSQYTRDNFFERRVMRETYSLWNIGRLAEAHLQPGDSINGKTGPFTITSFD